MNAPTSPKKTSPFFAAVRARGILNAMLDGPCKAFDKANPGWRSRWEYAPPSGDKTMIVAREAMGFRIVDASELEGVDSFTASQQKEGPIRRGDLILMAGPEDLINEIAMEDARRAYEDYKLPETAYTEHLRSIQVKSKDGSVLGTKPYGNITRKEEVVGVQEGKHELDEGGE